MNIQTIGLGILGGLGIMSVPLIIVVWYIWIRKRVKGKIVSKIGDSWRVVKKFNAGLDKDTFEHDNKEYILNKKKAILDSKDNPLLFFKLGVVEPLSFNPINKSNSKNAGMLHRILESNAYGKMLGEYRDKMFISIIIAVCVVAVIFILVQQYTIYNQSQRIKELSQFLYNSTKEGGDIFG